jgi:hypothetical protein
MWTYCPRRLFNPICISVLVRHNHPTFMYAYISIRIDPKGRLDTICTTSLTFSNSAFCPHTVFMCFVWIWEQTAIISLYSINWLVFITDVECVYCAVRTESLDINNPLKPSGHSMYHPVVIICTTSLTFTNSTFCPQTVFMFCVDLRTNSDYFPIQH